MYFWRSSQNYLSRIAHSFPVVGITGPRQSGKTTLAKQMFPEKQYISLENPQNFYFATQDPNGFLQQYHNSIIDECQRAPDLFSYIQTIVDQTPEKMGQFVLTGSNQFDLRAKISQSLAGRIGLVSLLPFSLIELSQAHLNFDLFEQIYRGFYPPLYSRAVTPQDWYSNYIQTYLEKDIRQIINVKNIALFQMFLKICAGRIGNLVNYSSLGNDCDISHTTAREWWSALESSYITFSLTPYFKNFSKRLIKSPKIYFYDTGLLCHLLGIRSSNEIATHALKGAIFENFVISEFYKFQFNRGSVPSFYFWRDNSGTEIDLIFECMQKLVPIEIKSGQTVNPDYFKNIETWKKYAQTEASHGFVFYGGNSDQIRTENSVYSWNNLKDEKFFTFLRM